MHKPISTILRELLRWAAMLLAVSALGSLAIPGHSALSLKLLGAALALMVLWFVFPGGRRNDS